MKTSLKTSFGHFTAQLVQTVLSHTGKEEDFQASPILVPSSFLLVVRPGATSSVLAPFVAMPKKIWDHSAKAGHCWTLLAPALRMIGTHLGRGVLLVRTVKNGICGSALSPGLFDSLGSDPQSYHMVLTWERTCSTHRENMGKPHDELRAMMQLVIHSTDCNSNSQLHASIRTSAGFAMCICIYILIYTLSCVKPALNSALV